MRSIRRAEHLARGVHTLNLVSAESRRRVYVH